MLHDVDNMNALMTNRAFHPEVNLYLRGLSLQQEFQFYS